MNLRCRYLGKLCIPGVASNPGNLRAARCAPMLFLKLFDLPLDLGSPLCEASAQLIGYALDLKPGHPPLCIPNLPDAVTQCLYLTGNLVLVNFAGVADGPEHLV